MKIKKEFISNNCTKITNGIIVLLFVLLIILSCIYDFRAMVQANKYLLTLRCNILYFINILTKSLPLIVIVLLIYLWRKFATRFIIKVEKLDFGGASIILERPEELFKQQIKNFMNTKRTLFYFDPIRDNIFDTIASFYKTYKFIREKINVYDTKSSQQSKYYKIANDMLQSLNEFLTSYQSDFRRWHDYKMKSLCDDEYNVSISEIQRKYWRYNEMVKGFTDLNACFLDYSKAFDINTDKWTATQKI